jgi:uncharacterized protein YjbJ (UPF0337 family)
MNNAMIETNWAEIKGAIKSKWGKFNDTDLDGLKGDLGKLAGKIQSTYGIAKEHADKQFEDFKLSVQVLIGQESPAPKAAAAAAPVEAKVADPTVLKNIKLA